MDEEDLARLYPWGGDIRVGNPLSPVAVVTMAEDFRFDPDQVAIYGNLKTENLGIEKIVANVVSNPNIRLLILCGREIKGHRSGNTLAALHANGVDDGGKVIGAKGAVPYIENVSREAIERFQQQVEIMDLLEVVDQDAVQKAVDDALGRGLECFGDPYMAEVVSSSASSTGTHLKEDVSLHRTLSIDLYGEIGSMAPQLPLNLHREITTDLYGAIGAS